jgi:two-component system response regulator MprA
MTGKLRIVVVDDDEHVRQGLRHLLGASGHDVGVFPSAEEMLGHDVAGVDCFLLDVCLPKLNGIELAERIRSTGCDAPIVLMTGDDHESTRRAISECSLPVVRKPFDGEDILELLAETRGDAVSKR